MVTGESATVQLLQPEEIQTLGDHVAVPRRRSEKDPIEAMLTGGADAEVRVRLRVPRVPAVLRLAQKLPDIRDVAG